MGMADRVSSALKAKRLKADLDGRVGTTLSERPTGMPSTRPMELRVCPGAQDLDIAISAAMINGSLTTWVIMRTKLSCWNCSRTDVLFVSSFLPRK